MSILRGIKRGMQKNFGILRSKKCCGCRMEEKTFYDETDKDGVLEAYMVTALTCPKCGKGRIIKMVPTSVRSGEKS